MPDDDTKGRDIPLGARILKLALDYDALKSSGESDIQMLTTLRRRAGWYDPNILSALESVAGLESLFELREIQLKELSVHMVLAADVRTTDGTILVAKGQEVSQSLCQRLANFARNRGVQEPIKVLVPAASHSRAGHLVRTADGD